MAYNKTLWTNDPSTTSPINADNLNKIENELVNLDQTSDNLLNNINAITGIINYTVTKSNASGTNVFVLPVSIPANMEINITNDTVDSSYIVILIDKDRGIHNLGIISSGGVKITTIEKETVEFRAVMSTGNQINSTISYGEKVLQRIQASENNIISIQNMQKINGWDNFSEWIKQSYNTSTGVWSYSTNTLSLADSIKVDSSVKITCVNGYKFAVRRWSASERIKANFVSDTGWVVAGDFITVKQGEIIDIALRKVSEESLDISDGINIRVYIDATNIVNYGYQVNGTPINFAVQKYKVSEISKIRSTPASQISPPVTEVQGMTIYNDIVFQLYANDVLLLIDFITNVKSQLSITSGHGDTIDFSNEFYDENDEFPLAYITADTNPAKVYVNRITRSETQLIRTLSFPLDKTGYYAGHSLDAKNNILYQVGYLKNSYNNPADNNLIVSAWDITELSDNGDETYTPRFIEKFNVPFYTTLQGQSFFDNKIVAVSSAGLNTSTKVIFIDVFGKKISTVMDGFPNTIKNVETEGVAFVDENDKYYMVLKTANVFFYRVDFN